MQTDLVINRISLQNRTEVAWPQASAHWMRNCWQPHIMRKTLITFLECQCFSLRDGCTLIHIVWGATVGNWTSLCSCRTVVSEIQAEVRWALTYMFTGSSAKMGAGKTRWRITLCERAVEMCGALHWDSWKASWVRINGPTKWVTSWECLLQITWSRRSRELSHLKTMGRHLWF